MRACVRPCLVFLMILSFIFRKRGRLRKRAGDKAATENEPVGGRPTPSQFVYNFISKDNDTSL